MHVLRLRSLTPVTYLYKLLVIHSLVAFLQLELFRVYSDFKTTSQTPVIAVEMRFGEALCGRLLCAILANTLGNAAQIFVILKRYHN
ncbi:hypothetical protein DWG93_17815 [Escherichia coli]|nr:hypothetical protein [Escherichia coli]EFO1476207.1 hypothetical protein [Escherichia coli]EFO1629583.1 hypothetical protein [Escherichia coli]EGE0245199.1 hypothetical protein [Escherichia coli]PSS42136.1 hypothetical protein BEM40_001450 [Escherichia sp. MOD1-EC5451]